MNKKKKKKISALILLLAITIGYALLSTTLKINGIANIKSNTWDIHFENVVANNESTVTAELPSITDNATKVNYEVELSLPGDFYEFTVDAVNDGSINGIIEKIDHKVYESDGVTEATLPSYIKYSIVYDGTSTAPQEGDILEAGESKTYRVRIEFDSEATTLPSTDLTYVIIDEVKYTQTKEEEVGCDSISDDINLCEKEKAQILANPNNYRHPDQSPTNLDIGLDKNCNVINLDMWVDVENPDNKVYSKIYDENKIQIESSCENCIFPATSAANVTNGEVKTKIPQYVLLSDESEFYPVTKISNVFGRIYDADRYYYDESIDDNVYLPRTVITKMPELPDTIEIIGNDTFDNQSIQTVNIPRNVKKIDSFAFANNGITSLTFASCSKLEYIDGFGANNITSLNLPPTVKRIESQAFYDNNLTGNLVLPQSVEEIGSHAFLKNHLTSVTLPSTASYVTDCIISDDESCDSFDSGVTINHNY